jgi:hypothetical protein
MAIYSKLEALNADLGLRMRLGKAKLVPRFFRKLVEGGNGTTTLDILSPFGVEICGCL